MAEQNKDASHQKKDMASWRPGSEPAEAKNVGGEGDFGVPVNTRSARDLSYVSENTMRSDPGVTAPFAWEHDGVRDHGAGAPDNGPGAGSAGDLDPDFVGVGTGGSGISISGPGDPAGADDIDETSSASASRRPAAKANPDDARRNSASANAGGSFVNGDLDLQNGALGQGTDAATNPARGDDSFAGEISRGEARGEDSDIDPSSATQN